MCLSHPKTITPTPVHGKTIFTKASAKRLGTTALDHHEELVSLLTPKAVLGEMHVIKKVSRVNYHPRGQTHHQSEGAFPDTAQEDLKEDLCEDKTKPSGE